VSEPAAAIDGPVLEEIEPLLEVNDLRVSIPTEDGVVKAVTGPSFRLARGRTLGIVGESGSGKSITALTLLGLTRRYGAQISGEVRFLGRDLLAMPEPQLRDLRGDEIAMIFQDPLAALHPFKKVGSQIVEAMTAHRSISRADARRRTVELFALVGIPDPARRLDDYPHEFSGGMRQRAMIAMALANEPQLLIADEPTTALDVTVQAQILALMRRLQAELGMAIIMITHDLGVIAEMADEVCVMYAGAFVEQAPVRELFGDPQHPYTWGLLGSIARLDVGRDALLVPIAGRPPSLISPPSGCTFHPRCLHRQPECPQVEPAFQALPEDPQHFAACVLDIDTRRRLWAERTAGRPPTPSALVPTDAELETE
jgi:peptide/nickel transport system ATP-binding protein